MVIGVRNGKARPGADSPQRGRTGACRLPPLTQRQVVLSKISTILVFTWCVLKVDEAGMRVKISALYEYCSVHARL